MDDKLVEIGQKRCQFTYDWLLLNDNKFSRIRNMKWRQVLACFPRFCVELNYEVFILRGNMTGHEIKKDFCVLWLNIGQFLSGKHNQIYYYCPEKLQLLSTEESYSLQGFKRYFLKWHDKIPLARALFLFHPHGYLIRLITIRSFFKTPLTSGIKERSYLNEKGLEAIHELHKSLGKHHGFMDIETDFVEEVTHLLKLYIQKTVSKTITSPIEKNACIHIIDNDF